MTKRRADVLHKLTFLAEPRRFDKEKEKTTNFYIHTKYAKFDWVGFVLVFIQP